jgi:hypothetical protein
VWQSKNECMFGCELKRISPTYVLCCNTEDAMMQATG